MNNFRYGYGHSEAIFLTRPGKYSFINVFFRANFLNPLFDRFWHVAVFRVAKLPSLKRTYAKDRSWPVWVYRPAEYTAR
jgi:hypothetical protein